MSDYVLGNGHIRARLENCEEPDEVGFWMRQAISDFLAGERVDHEGSLTRED